MDRLGTCSRSIQLIEAKLLLITQVKARNLVVEYRLMIAEGQRILASAVSESPKQVEMADALRKKLYVQRNAIYADLAKIFGVPDAGADTASDEGA